MQTLRAHPTFRIKNFNSPLYEPELHVLSLSTPYLECLWGETVQYSHKPHKSTL